MMELGATLCSRQSPACVICPVRDFCAGARGGAPAEFPRLKARALERREVTRVWCRRGEALLLHRAAAGARRLAGLHELPTVEQAGLAEALTHISTGGGASLEMLEGKSFACLDALQDA